MTILCTYAQNEVRGKVVDELGFPVANATITLKGTNTVTHSNFQGLFKIQSTQPFYWKMDIAAAGFLKESFYILEGGNAGNVMLTYALNLEAILEEDKTDDKRKARSPN